MTARFFFTFGVNHPYDKKYVEIEADTYDEARTIMIDAHKDRWSMQYTADAFDGQIDKYGLSRLALIAINSYGHWRAA